MVLITPKNRVEDDSFVKKIVKDGVHIVKQGSHKREPSNFFFMNMKQRGSKIMDMKPIRHYTDAPLYEAFWPFLMGMKVVGLFHNKEYADTLKYGCRYDKKECPPLSKRITPSSVYSFVIMLVLWVNAIRFLGVFESGEGFGPALFQKIITLCFFMLIAVSNTCCFLACHKYSNIPEFFYEWARLHQEYPGNYQLLYFDLLPQNLRSSSVAFLKGETRALYVYIAVRIIFPKFHFCLKT